MSTAHQLNYAVNAAAYLHAAKKGMKQCAEIKTEERAYNEYDRDIGNEYDIQPVTRRRNTSSSSISSTNKSLIRRSNRIKEQKQDQKQENNEAREAAAILASIADVAVTRSQKRNQNKVTWTDQDRATAAQAAAIAVEVAAEAAMAAEGKKKKEKSTSYWTRYQEKSRSTGRFQREMERVVRVDSYGYGYE
jgi:hypothetical protein